MERTFMAERAAHARAVAEAVGRHVGRARSPIPPVKIEHARLLKAQGDILGVIATKTGIPKTSLHRYLTPEIRHGYVMNSENGQQTARPRLDQVDRPPPERAARPNLPPSSSASSSSPARSPNGSDS
jgi:DNA invertase Pin-like site-specific DNA recombinase